MVTGKMCSIAGDWVTGDVIDGLPVRVVRRQVFGGKCFVAGSRFHETRYL